MIQYQLTDSIPFLLNQAGVGLGERFMKRIGPDGVTLPMYRVLAVLRQSETKTLSELSNLVRVEQSTLSRLIGQMVKRGLVTRKRPADNGRIVHIDLTPSGEAMADRLISVAIHFEATAVTHLSPTKVEELRRILLQINRHIETL